MVDVASLSVALTTDIETFVVSFLSRNESGELEMEGLKILLEFALARGNMASILKTLQDLLGKYLIPVTMKIMQI